MTARPEIDITDEQEFEHIVEERKMFLEGIKMEASLVFEAVFEAWRQVHRIRIGTPAQYLNHAEYLKAVEDPYPYEPEYIFYCMGK